MKRIRAHTALLVAYLVASALPVVLSIGLVKFGASPIQSAGNLVGHLLLWLTPIAATVGLVGRRSPVVSSWALLVCALWWAPAVGGLVYNNVGDPSTPLSAWLLLAVLALLPLSSVAVLLWHRDSWFRRR